MFKALILPLAKDDIREATLWYNEQQKGLGKKFTLEVRKKIKFIQQNPKAFGKRYKNIRTAVLNIFPFMIHYSVDIEKKTIIIIAILHTSRHPEIWKNRDYKK